MNCPYGREVIAVAIHNLERLQRFRWAEPIEKDVSELSSELGSDDFI